MNASRIRPIRKHAMALVACIGLSFIAAPSWAAEAPADIVKNTINSLVDKIQANRDVYRENSKALNDMVLEVLVPAIHSDRLAGLILGKHRRRATADQRKAFADEFQSHIIYTYAPALLEYTGSEKVAYEPVVHEPGADKVAIKAALISASGDRYPVVLHMSNRNDTSWRAYNLEVAGINFVSTYRATFGDIIAKKGVDGLIEDLRRKNAKLQS